MHARHAIENLLYVYAERIDAGDLGGVADLFEHAVFKDVAGQVIRRGRDEVLEMYRVATRIYEDTGTPRTRHVTTNAIIEIDESGEAASCRSYYTVFQQTPTLPLQPIIAGRYHDTFLRAADGWRFASRQIFCDLFGDLSQHLLIDANALADA